MSVHQIIYTSCMRGINGVNDGQQVFSYDAEFTDADNDDIKSLFSYQSPALEPGVVMTEEIAASFPRAFIFRSLENNTCALALNTYLGRDYMGSAGRFGNHLSHVVVADVKDFNAYPCEFYGSTLLRDHMEFEEVNNPERPDYLPVPVMEKGYTVDIDIVLEFLSIGDRLEIYKNMLAAMLAYEKARKRVVICDEPENIVLWIAALEYAVPLRTALGINFTTYEYDPSLSASQICGVVERGTRYTEESKNQHFVFDLLQNECVEFEKDANFYEFIDTAFSLSYDSIQDFHDFLAGGYSYTKADEEMYAAYALYSMLSDGITGITKDKLNEALLFAEKYADKEEKRRIAQNLLLQYNELLTTDREVFQSIIEFILSLNDVLENSEYEEVKNTVIDRILREFLDEDISEETFINFYNNIGDICRRRGVALATELMKENNSRKLFEVMRTDVRTWKIAVIIRIISTYVKENHLPVSELEPDKSLGKTYYGIISAVYSQNMQSGFFLATCIMDEFADDCCYLVNMALNIEGVLLDMSDGQQETEKLWKYLGQKMISEQAENFQEAYSILSQYERYEQIFMLFALEIKAASEPDKSCEVFERHFREFVRGNRRYASYYGVKVLNLYYGKLCEFGTDITQKERLALFEILADGNIEVEFSDQIVNDLVKNIPLEYLSEENGKLVQQAFRYTNGFRKKPVEGKLLLLSIGLVLDSVNNTDRLRDKLSQLTTLTQNNKANLTGLSGKTAESYFEWTLPTVCRFSRKAKDIHVFYRVFNMTEDIAKIFFDNCTKIYLKRSKEEKDFRIFAEFFRFVYRDGSPQNREDLGKALCRLNKNKMEELDDTIRDIYYEDKKLIRCWDEVKEIAESTNPLLNNLSNLFRRRK